MRRCKAASPGHPSLHGLRDHDPKARKRAPSSPAPPSSAKTQPGRTLRPGQQAEVGPRENFPTPGGRSEHTGRLRGRKRRLFEDRGQEPSPSSSPLFPPESPDRAGTVHSPAGTPPPDGHLFLQVPQRRSAPANVAIGGVPGGSCPHCPGALSPGPKSHPSLRHPLACPPRSWGRSAASLRPRPAATPLQAAPGPRGCLQTPASGPARGA